MNKYLEELFNEKLVDREGRRGFYSLTPKGRREARRALTKQTLTQLPGSILEEFVVKYKEVIAKEIDSYYADRAAESGMNVPKEQVFTSSTIDKDLHEEFSEEEILKLWLTERGACIVGFYEQSKESHQRYVLELKKKLKGNLS